MLYICNKNVFCEEAPFCGWAKPHDHTTECDTCPRDKSAKCLPVDEMIPYNLHRRQAWFSTEDYETYVERRIL